MPCLTSALVNSAAAARVAKGADRATTPRQAASVVKRSGLTQRSLWRTVSKLEDSSQLFVRCRRWSTPAVLEVDGKMLGDSQIAGLSARRLRP